MSKTIVQDYGPIYGEPVNGTVLGRPNGSVYVPSTNTINLLSDAVYIRNNLVGNKYRVLLCDENGVGLRYGMVAQSQDVASYMSSVLFADSELTTVLTGLSQTAGLFNQTNIQYVSRDYQLDSDETYYLCAGLMNNGSFVAFSDSITLSVWEESP